MAQGFSEVINAQEVMFAVLLRCAFGNEHSRSFQDKKLVISQSIDALICEETLPFAKYFRHERKERIPRLTR